MSRIVGTQENSFWVNDLWLMRICLVLWCGTLISLQIRKLKLQLEEERQKCSRSDSTVGGVAGLQNGSDLQFIEMQSKCWETGQSRSVCRLSQECDCRQAAGFVIHISQEKLCYQEWLVLNQSRKAVLVSNGADRGFWLACMLQGVMSGLRGSGLHPCGQSDF